MATSLRSASLGRVRLPRDRWTIDIESSTETSCLTPPGMSRSVRPSVGRISAVRAVHEVAAVELGRDLHRKRATAQGGLGDRGVGGGGDEVAAHAEENLCAAVAHRADGLDGVVAVLAGL